MATSRFADILKCNICLTKYDNPRTLPCQHSFCLNCITGVCMNREAGTYVDCPKCRKPFKIPVGGADAFPHNFDMASLVAELKLTSEGCKKHGDKPLEMYCFDCEANICMMCFAVAHQQHKCKELDEVSKSFEPQMDKDRQRVSERIIGIHSEKKRLDDEKSRFDDDKRKAKAEIMKQGEEVKRRVDSQMNQLLEDVDALNSKTENALETRKENIQSALRELENFNAVSLEVQNEGKPSHITRAAGKFHASADELLQTHVTSDHYVPPRLKFTPTDIGKLAVQELPGTPGRGNSLVGSLKAIYTLLYDFIA